MFAELLSFREFKSKYSLLRKNANYLFEYSVNTAWRGSETSASSSREAWSNAAVVLEYFPVRAETQDRTEESRSEIRSFRGSWVRIPSPPYPLRIRMGTLHVVSLPRSLGRYSNWQVEARKNIRLYWKDPSVSRWKSNASKGSVILA
jgi:hypothetical protein